MTQWRCLPGATPRSAQTDRPMPNEHRANRRFRPQRRWSLALAVALLVATGGLAETASGEAQRRGRARQQAGPRNAAQHNARGVELIGESKLEEALEAFENAIELDPELAQAHFNKGLVLSDLSRLDDAIASYATAVQLDPAYAEAHFRLGQAWYGKGQVQECIEALQRAVEIEPSHAPAHLSLGQILFTEGRARESVAALQNAVQADPELADAHLALGNVWGALGDVDEAIKAFGEAVRLAPDKPEAHFRLAVSLYGAEEYAEAWKHVHQAQDLELAVPEPFLDALRQEMPEPKRQERTTRAGSGP